MKRIWSILLLSFLLALSVLACGGSAGPVETPTLALSPTPSPIPTPSAADHVSQGETYKQAGDVDAALAEFQTALGLEPENAAAHTHLGLIFIDQARFEEAASEFEAALAVEPENSTAQGGICVANAFVKPDQAEGQCLTALEDQPENADLHNGLGVAMANQNRFEEAFAAFKEAIRLSPDHIWAHYNLGYMYLQNGRLDEAIAELQEAVHITPENSQAYYNLALAYAQQKNYDRAIPAYEETLRLDSTVAAAYFDLGTIYRELGQVDEAIAAFEKFLELKPDSSNRATIEAIIAALQQPVELPPGNYFQFEEAIEASDEDGADNFSFFNSPAVVFGMDEDSVAITIRPQNELDVSIAILDTATGDQIVMAEADDAGPGGEESLALTLPEPPGSAMGVYVVRVTAKAGAGSYQAFFSGSPAVGFFISDGWEVDGVLGDQMALFYVVSALGNSGEIITIAAVPQKEDNLDLFITAVDTTGNQNLGTLNDGGVGETESDQFVPDNSVYIFIVGDQQGNPGHLVMKYTK